MTSSARATPASRVIGVDFTKAVLSSSESRFASAERICVGWQMAARYAPFVSERQALKLLEVFWRRHIEQVYRCRSERARISAFRHWQSGFRDAIDREYAAQRMFREHRRKWEQDRERSKQQQQYELLITGGRPRPPVKIKPPPKSDLLAASSFRVTATSPWRPLPQTTRGKRSTNA
jgi:hypothetical protein